MAVSVSSEGHKHSGVKEIAQALKQQLAGIFVHWSSQLTVQWSFRLTVQCSNLAYVSVHYRAPLQQLTYLQKSVF